MEVQNEQTSNPSNATVLRLVQALDIAYNRPWRMLWRSFMHGFMAALGATIGTALFFTIMLYIFQSLGGINLLKPGIDQLQNLIIPKELRSPSTTADTQALQQLVNGISTPTPQAAKK